MESNREKNGGLEGKGSTEQEGQRREVEGFASVCTPLCFF